MKLLQRWQSVTAAVFIACSLAACGGGGGGDSAAPGAVTPPPTDPTPPPASPGAPALTGNIATDGLNWLNYRRSQTGIPVLTRNSVIDTAAARHSEYQRLNNIVTHDQEVGKPGFTGVTLYDRLNQAGYVVPGSGYFYGEVISASTSNSGVFLAEELITAIYHRFVIFEPRFKEIGAGSATAASGYTYFTTNFGANGGYGPGIGKGNLAPWPFNGQTNVTRNFLSDYESPDPVAGQNEVGYPVSVHADADVTLTVTSFSMRPRGGSDVNAKLLAKANDPYAPKSAVSIVPLSVLASNTVYDVTFVGTIDAVPITKTWSFTTKP